MEFQFRLAPVDDILPWCVDVGRPALSWYGLTDGWFWIDVGGQELFRYAAGAMDDRAQEDSGFRHQPLLYDRYPVVRYWEDLLELLPAVLDPLPVDLAAQVANAQEWDEWQSAALQWQEAQATDTAGDTYYTAQRWWGARTWHALHLAYAPQIALWRAGDTVHVRWDNRSVTLDGMPVWDSLQGEVTMSVVDFLAAVRSFHARFLSAMAQRVQEAVTEWPRPEVKIDAVALLREQEDRTSWLESAIGPRKVESSRDFTWHQVRAAMLSIEQSLS